MANYLVHFSLHSLIILVYCIFASESSHPPLSANPLPVLKDIESDVVRPHTSSVPHQRISPIEKDTTGIVSTLSFPLRERRPGEKEGSLCQHDQGYFHTWTGRITFFSQYNAERRHSWPEGFKYSPPTLLNRNVPEPLSDLQRHSQGLFHSHWCKDGLLLM